MLAKITYFLILFKNVRKPSLVGLILLYDEILDCILFNRDHIIFANKAKFERIANSGFFIKQLEIIPQGKLDPI